MAMTSPRLLPSPSQSPRQNARQPSIGRSHSPTSSSRSFSNDKITTTTTQPSQTVPLRVENLTRNVNADHLREIFSKFGLVINVKMALPRGKASAIIRLATQKDAENVKDHMHDGWLDGNKLRVLLDSFASQGEKDQCVNNTRRTVVTRLSVSPKSRRNGRFRSVSNPATSRGRHRSPIRGGRGRHGPSPFRGRSRSFTRRGGRSRSPAFRRRVPSPFRGKRRSPLLSSRSGRRRSPSPFRRRRSPSRSRSRSRSQSFSRSRSRTRGRSRSVSRSRSRSFSSRSRSRSSSRGRRRRSVSRSSRSRS